MPKTQNSQHSNVTHHSTNLSSRAGCCEDLQYTDVPNTCCEFCHVYAGIIPFRLQDMAIHSDPSDPISPKVDDFPYRDIQPIHETPPLTNDFSRLNTFCYPCLLALGVRKDRNFWLQARLLLLRASRDTGWWFQPIWKILVKMDHFPRYCRDENNKFIWNHNLEHEKNATSETRSYVREASATSTATLAGESSAACFGDGEALTFVTQ